MTPQTPDTPRRSPRRVRFDRTFGVDDGLMLFCIAAFALLVLLKFKGVF